jgi:hypothetical protein
MGFLRIALPGLLSMSGHENPGLPFVKAMLASELWDGKHSWTVFFGSRESSDGLKVFYPYYPEQIHDSLGTEHSIKYILSACDRLEDLKRAVFLKDIDLM